MIASGPMLPWTAVRRLLMMTPIASRPYMPGYGVEPPDGGMGLLPWSWAEERLIASHEYWLATVRPDGRPHLMPVWGVWSDGSLWFSSSEGSRKARNLRSIRTAASRSPIELSP